MKKVIVGGIAAAATYYLVMRFVIKSSPEDQGFIEISDGFGMDDIALGVIPFMVGCAAGRMV